MITESTKKVQRFETGLSANYLQNWDELYVIKEFLQNAVYAKSILGDEISIEHDGEYAVIKNWPSGFSKDKLLLGESEQRGIEGSPGNFGEGFKVGILVANRLGMKCHIQTNGFHVDSALEPSSLNPDVESLVFYIEDDDTNEGTTFKIQCSKETLEKGKSYFAVLQGMDPDLTKRTTLLLSDKSIYANGVKITDLPSIYGYNLTDDKLINRDRSTVDIELLKMNIRLVLGGLKDEEIVTEIIKNINKDDSLLESQAGLYSVIDESLWRKVVHKLYGNKVAIATGGESDTQARYRNFKVLTNLPKAWVHFFQSTLDIHYTNELRETTVGKNRHVKPTPEESKLLGWAKRLVKLYYADYGKVKISENVVDQYGNECLGLYDRVEDVIWLKRSLLSDKKELFKVLLHETVHRKTGASDNTVEFTMGFEDACWGILTRGKGDI